MGLRDRLLSRIKRTLRTPQEGPPPAAAPASRRPTPAQPMQPVPPAQPVPPTPAQPAPPAPPAEREAARPAPAARPALEPGAIPPQVLCTDDGDSDWASDYATDDAPVRNAHYREAFTTSDRAHQVRVICEAEALDTTFDCEPGEFILDAADRAGQELPFSCRSGGCLSCSGKLLSGVVVQGEQYVLEEEHIAEHFFLMCCSTVHSDVVVRTHQEDSVS